jgi:uracil-DNA glycosylase
VTRIAATPLRSTDTASAGAPANPLSVVRDDIVSCTRCPRLRAHCESVARARKAAHRDETYWGLPVPGFGDPDAKVVVLGLAPAAHGANRTGRVFTGDGSGDFLMRAMHAAGFANIATSRTVDDGLELSGAYILAAVRCAPPDNKPTPEEIRACHAHLEAEMAALARASVVVALGRIASDAYWRLVAARGHAPRPRPRFAHGHVVPSPLAAVPSLVESYHPSRQNTNTGRLTADMLEQVFLTAKALASDGSRRV